MTTITFSEKELKETLNIREQLDAVFRLLTMKEILIMPKKNALLDLIRLKINGGPKNLSSDFDFYLYNKA